MPALEFLLKGKRRNDNSVDQYIEANNLGHLMTSKGLPDFAHLVNDGTVWQVGEAAAVAAVTTLPTTTAQISLYNDNQDGSNKIYVVIAVFGTQVGNGAALNSWHIAHCINTIKPTTKPTADIAVASIKSLKTPGPNYGGKAIVDLAATVTDDLWKPVGPFAGTTVASLSGTAIYYILDGSVVVAPGGMYSLAAIAAATGITTRLGYVWAEVTLPMKES